MTEVLLHVALGLVAVAGTATVLTRDPARQAVVLSAYGLVTGLLLLLLQAPDVAMSQIAIGSAVVPLMVVLTIGKLRSYRDRQEDR